MSNTQRAILILVVVVVLLGIVLGQSIMFTVNEREQAVVLQFGDPVESYTEPGLHFKLPFVQEVKKLPKTLQFWNGSGTDILVDLPTADGKKIEVTPWAIWKITDPIRFVQVLRTVEIAEVRVNTFVRGAIRNEITANNLVEVIRNTDRVLPLMFQDEGLEEEQEDSSGLDQSQQTGDDETGQVTHPDLPSTESEVLDKIAVGRDQIVQRIKGRVRKQLAMAEDGQEMADRGIELVDVGIAKIDFVDTIRDAAFQRLIAVMESRAQKNEADGERLKKEILNKTNAQVERIEGEGKGESNRVRGEMDAKIIQMYADAIRQAGEFYYFTRTLDAYKMAIGKNTHLVLSTDSEMFKLLKTVPPPVLSAYEEPESETAEEPAEEPMEEGAAEESTTTETPES